MERHGMTMERWLRFPFFALRDTRPYRQWLADAALLLVTLIWGATFVMVKDAVAAYPVYNFLALRFFFAALTLFIINVFLQNPFGGFSNTTWLSFLGAALISQVIGYFSMTYALGHLPASIVSPTMIGQPVMTTLLAIPLLGEIPGKYQLIGGAIALTGIYLVNQAHARAEKAKNGTL